ncbi:MAG: hypothetical protein J5379_00485 [Clostridiales bacterium]|nr:hypothetical protein [Clostridiales bacterium]
MPDYNLLIIYADNCETVYNKMFFNDQFTQYEFDTLKKCADMEAPNRDFRRWKDKAQDLLDIERQLEYIHCRSVRIY